MRYILAKLEKKLGGRPSRFCRDEKGNFALMTAAIASTLALAVGFAVNTTQMYNIKSGLTNALDAAVTSTARDLTTGKIKPEDARERVEAFLKANFDPQFAATDLVVLDSLVVDQTANTVTAGAHVDADLFFPLFSTGGTKRISRESASLYSDKAIEVAMMLDVTGSMSGQKIKDLKTAANNALDAFLAGQDKSKPRVRVAIIPYADAGNTGSPKRVVYAEKDFTTGAPPAQDDPLLAPAAYTAPAAGTTPPT